MERTAKSASILLNKARFDCLREKALPGSVAANCLNRAVSMRGVIKSAQSAYCIQCTSEETHAILELATEHCREAVADIRESIRRFGV